MADNAKINKRGNQVEDKFISWKRDKAYSLVSGGLIYTILYKLGFYKYGEKGLLLRSLLFALLCWLPLLVLTLLDGSFFGGEDRLSFLDDFVVHIRLLIVVPFLIWVEKMIDPAFDGYMNSTRRLIPPDEEKDFDRIADRADKLSNSWIPEIVFLVLIYGLYILNWNKLDLFISRWSVPGQTAGINAAGIYYILIAMPMYQLLLARWLWRWIVWAYSAIRFSNLNLRIESTHADQMAGLEYMGVVPMTFCTMSLAFSMILSALIGEEIIYHGDTLKAYIYVILAFIIIVPLLVHLPLFAFIPTMIRARIRGINRFGSLIQYHNNLYRDKWLEGNLPEDEKIMPSIDHSSMSDINGSYQQAVKGMSIIPLNWNWIIYTILMLLIPFTPLILTMYSISELISKLVQIVTG